MCAQVIPDSLIFTSYPVDWLTENYLHVIIMSIMSYVLVLKYTINNDFSYFQFFISALSFATFAVSPELPQNRLQLSFTLLLTSVAFKFVINQSLPKISYLTYMVSIFLCHLLTIPVFLKWEHICAWFVFQMLKYSIYLPWNKGCSDSSSSDVCLG